MRRTYALVLLLAVAACSPAEPDVDWQESTPPPASETLPHDGAPDVAEPLDVGDPAAPPCRLLDAAAAEGIVGTPMAERYVRDLSDDGSGSPAECNYVLADELGAVGLGLGTWHGHGLSSLYQAQAEGKLTTFRPVPDVEGYPGLVYEDETDQPGSCLLAVGLRNDMTFDVALRLRPGQPRAADPCPVALALASAGIRALTAA